MKMLLFVYIKLLNSELHFWHNSCKAFSAGFVFREITDV